MPTWVLATFGWLVSFMEYDMGYFDLESHRVQALENPFGPKVLTM